MLLDGLHIPLTTPFFADGRLNLRKLEANVAHYSLTPAAGLLALGETGEATLLSDAESVQVLRCVAHAAEPAKVLLAGVTRDSVARSMASIEEAAALGYDVAVVRQPVSSGMTAQEQRLYLEAVADRTTLPLLLGGAIPLDVVCSLAKHKNVLGYINNFLDAEALRQLREETAGLKREVEVTSVFAAVTGRMRPKSAPEALLSVAMLIVGGVSSPATAKVKTRMKTVGFQMLVNRSAGLLDALTDGAVGAILPLAVVAPQACYEVLAAWKDGDRPLAEEKQRRLNEAALKIEGELGVGALKYGCDLNGYAGGVPRLPRLPLRGEEQTMVASLLSDLRA